MPDSSSPRRPRRLTETLLVVALLMGGAFFWANWDHAPRSTDEAFAAPRSSPPRVPQSPTHWIPATPAQRAAGAKTIRAQLHAFDVGNWKEAVKYQSAGLKGNFSSPDLFGVMITRNYPAFVNARRVEFGEAVASGSTLQMMVRLTGRNGHTTQALYDLVKESGNYRIGGVSGGMVAPPGNQPDESDGATNDGGLTV